MFNVRNKWLLIILFLYFILAINYTINVPIFEAPDEPDHFAHVKYLLKYNRLPLLEGKNSETPRTAIHPPLYYFLSAIIYAPFQTYGDPIEITCNEKFGLINRNRYFHHDEKLIDHINFYIVRLFSIILGMGTIIFGWKAAEECFDANYYLTILSTALIAFIPQFIYISASINSDNLANLISTVIIWLLIKAAKKESTAKRDIYLIGIILGLAAITKFTVLFLIPLAMIIFYIIESDKKIFLKNALIILLMICAVSGWYYLRNYVIYDYALGGNFVIKRSLFSFYFIRPFGDIMLLSFFGLFGWMSIVMSKAVYLFYIIFYGAGFFAAMKFIVQKQEDIHSNKKINSWIMLLSILLSLMTNIRYNMTNIDFQGRHMFAIIAPFAILAVQGHYYIYIWFKEKYHIFIENKVKTLIILLVIVILASLNIYIVDVFIKPSFARAFL